ncbi:hypothetical protein QUF80_21820 [Desulfococcaceae bacterium HSG8]|nr:hypothetical protein [Desulfococcaceae bacterium HSG8]
MSSVLIVESKNDEAFIRALVEHMNLRDIQFDEPICSIGDYECLEGLNLKKLILALDFLKSRLPLEDITSIGIILDHDGQREKRIELINTAINEVFEAAGQISDTGKFVPVSAMIDGEITGLKLACFLTHVDEKGELETILKAIKAKPSPYADCLEAWKACLKDAGKDMSDKNFDKFWLDNYIRFDTCSRKEKKQAGRKCSMRHFDYIMKNKRNIWNFDHPVLEDFKAFLGLFR